MGNTPGVHFKSISEKLKWLHIDPCTKFIPIAKTHHKTNRVTETKQKPQKNPWKRSREQRPWRIRRLLDFTYWKGWRWERKRSRRRRWLLSLSLRESQRVPDIQSHDSSRLSKAKKDRHQNLKASWSAEGRQKEKRKKKKHKPELTYNLITTKQHPKGRWWFTNNEAKKKPANNTHPKHTQTHALSLSLSYTHTHKRRLWMSRILILPIKARRRRRRKKKRGKDWSQTSLKRERERFATHLLRYTVKLRLCLLH